MTSNRTFIILDIFLSLFFVGPFTVLFWRGTFVGLYQIFISGNLFLKIDFIWFYNSIIFPRCSIIREMATSFVTLYSWNLYENLYRSSETYFEGKNFKPRSGFTKHCEDHYHLQRRSIFSGSMGWWFQHFVCSISWHDLASNVICLHTISILIDSSESI